MPLPPVTLPIIVEPWLTPDPAKRERYADDLYFWEGQASLGPAGGDPEALRNITFLLVKPETIAGRRVAPLLSFLAGRGYRVIVTSPLRLDRHQARALWRYQLNTVPLAHVRALEMLVTAGELFLVGLYHPEPPAATAAAALSQAKGSSAGPKDPGSLRELLGRPALMLNFAHAPDDPADILRELAILCPPARQRSILTQALDARTWPPARFAATARGAAAVMTARYTSVAPHDLDVSPTLDRLRARLDGAETAGLTPAARAAVLSGRIEPGRELDAVTGLDAALGLPRWDRIVAAAHLVDALRTDRPPLLGPPPRPAG